MQPYLTLGDALGTVLSQCLENVDSLRLEYFGDITGLTLRPLTASVLAGFLRPSLGAHVNVVNAHAVARDRGLQVEESKSTEKGGYSSLVRVIARSADREHGVAGTVFDGERGRLVEFNGVPIEVSLAGHVLVFVNEDTPGVIGHVGSCLAERAINIADMSLGRAADGATAVCAVTLDEPLDGAGLDELVARAGLRWARVISL